MFAYLKQYRWADMQEIRANERADPRHSDVTLEGKLCVITGCTSGVGLAAAETLAARGASLLMVNRSEEKSEQLCARLRAERPPGSDAAFTHLTADFASLPQVHTAVDAILRSHSRIDLLINNAGMHSTKRTLTPEGFETVFCVNHLASFVLTYRLLDTMARTPGSRIIQVSSQGHRFGGLDPDDLDWRRRLYSGLRSYGASKTAQLLTVWEFADRLAGSGATINAMHPGAVRSGIGMNNGLAYRTFKRLFVDRGLADPAVSGQAIHYLAASADLAEISGCYFNLTHPEKPAPHALDRDLGRRVWDISLRLTGLG
jgi:NAD(P)-dependent dehydrogenase (short-subunit alcohol dehydrogenase family)